MFLGPKIRLYIGKAFELGGCPNKLVSRMYVCVYIYVYINIYMYVHIYK